VQAQGRAVGKIAVFEKGQAEFLDLGAVGIDGLGNDGDGAAGGRRRRRRFRYP
jgi:hypothetical protein